MNFPKVFYFGEVEPLGMFFMFKSYAAYSYKSLGVFLSRALPLPSILIVIPGQNL
jgi:hypothetical protein